MNYLIHTFMMCIILHMSISDVYCAAEPEQKVSWFAYARRYMWWGVGTVVGTGLVAGYTLRRAGEYAGTCAGVGALGLSVGALYTSQSLKDLVHSGLRGLQDRAGVMEQLTHETADKTTVLKGVVDEQGTTLDTLSQTVAGHGDQVGTIQHMLEDIKQQQAATQSKLESVEGLSKKLIEKQERTGKIFLFIRVKQLMDEAREKGFQGHLLPTLSDLLMPGEEDIITAAYDKEELSRDINKYYQEGIELAEKEERELRELQVSLRGSEISQKKKRYSDHKKLDQLTTGGLTALVKEDATSGQMAGGFVTKVFGALLPASLRKQ